METNPTDIDWARLAAFIDGEGHIGIKRSPSSSRRGYGLVLRIAISNTDVSLIYWLVKTFGLGTMQKGVLRTGQHKAVHTWEVYGRNAAYMLTQCLPYFVMKRDQAEAGLDFQRLVIPHPIGRGRHVDDTILDARDLCYQRLKTMTRRGPDSEVVN